MEMSVAITCGNLPFLPRLFGCMGARKGKSSGYNARKIAEQGPEKMPSFQKAKLNTIPVTTIVSDGTTAVDMGGFSRLDSPTGSDIELKQQQHQYRQNNAPSLGRTISNDEDDVGPRYHAVTDDKDMAIMSVREAHVRLERSWDRDLEQGTGRRI